MFFHRTIIRISFLKCGSSLILVPQLPSEITENLSLMYKHVTNKMSQNSLTNGGSQRYVEKGSLKSLTINVHMNTESTVIILDFKHVASIPGVCISIDTEN